MNVSEIFNKCNIAFASREYPGNDNIVHCSYDKKYGGESEGPGRECAEVIETYMEKPKSGNTTNWMGSCSYGLASITPLAFAYFLSSAIDLVLQGLDKTGSVAESMEFRFKGLDSLEWQDSHIGKLSMAELECVRMYFEYQFQQDEYYRDEESYEEILSVIAKYSKTAT